MTQTLNRTHQNALIPWKCDSCGWSNVWHSEECTGCEIIGKYSVSEVLAHPELRAKVRRDMIVPVVPDEEEILARRAGGEMVAI